MMEMERRLWEERKAGIFGLKLMVLSGRIRREGTLPRYICFFTLSAATRRWRGESVLDAHLECRHCVCATGAFGFLCSHCVGLSRCDWREKDVEQSFH
jgi:hypothetical protein